LDKDTILCAPDTKIVFVSARTYHALAYRSHFVVSSPGLYIEAIFLAIVFPALWGYLWFTRDLNLDAITPKESRVISR
jgi:hypothetical protein